MSDLRDRIKKIKQRYLGEYNTEETNDRLANECLVEISDSSLKNLETLNKVKSYIKRRIKYYQIKLENIIKLHGVIRPHTMAKKEMFDIYGDYKKTIIEPECKWNYFAGQERGYYEGCLHILERIEDIIKESEILL